MIAFTRNIQYSVTIACISTITMLYAQSIDLPFEMNEVIENVSRHALSDYPLSKHKQSKSEWLREGEFLIDTNIVYVPAVQNQREASIAFDGTNYLIVWVDSRIGCFDIYGARVSSNGTVLDSSGITISTAVGWQLCPSVVFDGTNYLVVWQDSRRYPIIDIYGARISPTGTVLDPDGIAISTVVSGKWYPSVAFDGTNYLVVWMDSRNVSYDIYGARVSPSGTVLDSLGIAISTAADDEMVPSVAFDGTNYLVVWDDRNGFSDIYGARVSPNGTVLDSSGIAISIATNYQNDPSIAFDGTNYLVVWEDSRNGSFDIYGARVSPSGTVLDSLGIAISTTADDQKYPSIAFDGTNYLVMWEDQRNGHTDIYGARVSSTGAVLDPSGITISIAARNQEEPAVAFGDTNYLVVWQDWRCSPLHIYGSRVSPTGKVLNPDGFFISITANDQWFPSVAFDGTNYLIVWQDRCGDFGCSDICAARVSPSGTILDSLRIAISTAANNQRSPSVAFDGINYLIVWMDSRNYYYDIYGARVSPNGTVLDSLGIAISTTADDEMVPSVAFDGTNYLVVWMDLRSGSFDIYGARVSPNGTVLDSSGIAISTADDWQAYPSVAFDGTNYLVCWRHYGYSLYGARVSPNGIVLDPDGIAISTTVDCRPSIAFDSTNYLVVWQDTRNGSFDIYGARVSPNGTVLDSSGIAISTAAGWQLIPSVAFDGTNYLVVWEDNRNGLSDIYGARVSPTGTVIDSFSISLQSGKQTSPALAHGEGNQLLISYSSYTDRINGHLVNTLRIWGTFYPFVGVEEDVELRKPTTGFGLCIYPNPVHGKCNIKYALPQKTPVYISLYDVMGRLIKKIINENQNSGVYETTFETLDFAQGVYFIRLNTKNYSEVQKIILLE